MKTFTCAMCHHAFVIDPTWSDQDAIDEATATFGEIRAEDLPSERVCDNCYKVALLDMAVEGEPFQWTGPGDKP
jgi:rubredoxin